MKLTAHRLHKWAGLTALLWLAILGLTGFLLAHREWRWQWQGGIPTAWVPERVARTADITLTRFLLVDPDHPALRLAGGERGLWRSLDGGVSWTKADAADDGSETPQFATVLADPRLGWQRLWAATDDGVWLSRDQGASWRPWVLADQRVSWITPGRDADSLIAVLDKSRLVSIRLWGAPTVTPLPLAPPGDAVLPQSVSLSRWLSDLHQAKGLGDSDISVWVNDISGWGWFVLGLSGLAYWGLPKLWRKRPATADTRRTTLRWLFNTHSGVIGIATALPVLYLIVTGIYLGHFSDLSPWVKPLRLDRAALGPVYHPGDWKDWIESVAVDAHDPDRLLVATRIGLLESPDNGATWASAQAKDQTDPTVPSRRLFRLDGRIFAPNGMANPAYVRTDDGQWQRSAALEKLAGRHLPAEVLDWQDGQLAWRHGRDLYVSDRALTTFTRLPGTLGLPSEPMVPWYTLMNRLHTGILFHPDWKWVNDVFAALALLLTITGLIRWWKRKWLPAPAAKPSPCGNSAPQPAQ